MLLEPTTLARHGLAWTSSPALLDGLMRLEHWTGQTPKQYRGLAG
jgi:hypothetical protein